MLRKKLKEITVYEYEGEDYTSKELLDKFTTPGGKNIRFRCCCELEKICKESGVAQAQVIWRMNIKDWRRIYHIMRPLEELRDELDITD